MAQNHPIIIFGFDPSNYLLILSDNGKTMVDPGDTVTWIVFPGSGVSSIKDITLKQKPENFSSVNIFKPPPGPLGSSKNWMGKIDPNVPWGSIEEYNIVWEDSSGETHFFDPKIQVN